MRTIKHFSVCTQAREAKRGLAQSPPPHLCSCSPPRQAPFPSPLRLSPLWPVTTDIAQVAECGAARHKSLYHLGKSREAVRHLSVLFVPPLCSPATRLSMGRIVGRTSVRVAAMREWGRGRVQRANLDNTRIYGRAKRVAATTTCPSLAPVSPIYTLGKVQ